MNPNKITCVCPTHGRAWIIGEAVSSFLRQEPCGMETELLILNDCPEQPLMCVTPGVRIINKPEPVPNICDKFNLAVYCADSEWVAWWEDDDISLPNRLRLSVERGVNQGSAYKQRNAWCWNHGILEGPNENLFFGSTIFRREDWLNHGGAGSVGYPDQNAYHNLLQSGTPMVQEVADPADIFFIYRWAGMGIHDSGFGGGAMNDPATRFAAFRAATLADPRFKCGSQVIEPSWRQDYSASAEAMIRSVK